MLKYDLLRLGAPRSDRAPGGSEGRLTRSRSGRTSAFRPTWPWRPRCACAEMVGLSRSGWFAEPRSGPAASGPSSPTGSGRPATWPGPTPSDEGGVGSPRFRVQIARAGRLDRGRLRRPRGLPVLAALRIGRRWRPASRPRTRGTIGRSWPGSRRGPRTSESRRPGPRPTRGPSPFPPSAGGDGLPCPVVRLRPFSFSLTSPFGARVAMEQETGTRPLYDEFFQGYEEEIGFSCRDFGPNSTYNRTYRQSPHVPCGE